MVETGRTTLTELEITRLSVFDFLAEDPPNHAAATEEVVRFVVENNNIFTIRDDTNIEMWIYQDGIYVPNGGTYIQEVCRGILEQRYTTTFSNRVAAKIQADTFVDGFDFFQRKSKDSICVKNGYLNIFTRQLRPYTPDEIFFEKLPLTYDPTADCPHFKQHLVDVLKHEGDIPLLQENLGHLLYNDYRYEAVLIMSGDGANGKTQTCNVIVSFLGQDNVSAVSLQAICNESFSRSELLNKRANICGEVNNKIIEDTEWFKKLTGREWVQANRKGKPYVKFYNNSKLIFNLNEIPQTKDQSDGFFRRIIILEFPYKFLPAEQFAKATEKEKKWVKLRDTKHLDKMTTDAELSGVLNFALDGVERLEKNDCFSYSKSIDEVRQMWIRKSSSFEAFCLEQVDEDASGVVSKDELRREFALYCKTHKLKTVSDLNIKIVLANKYGCSDKYITMGYDRQYVWEGIKLHKIYLNQTGGVVEHITPNTEGNAAIEGGIDGKCEVCGTYVLARLKMNGRWVCCRGCGISIMEKGINNVQSV